MVAYHLFWVDYYSDSFYPVNRKKKEKEKKEAPGL